MRRRAHTAALVAIACLLAPDSVAEAHSGPPFPIVSDRTIGAYRISIWTDPDTTEDGRAAGQFWVVLDAADGTSTIPAATQASVTIRPLDREGPARDGRAEPVDGRITRQFVALLMDHEGPFGVRVTVDGPLGRATVDSQVDATYDLRPARGLIALYLMPFVLVGGLWVKALLRRRNKRLERT
jgi:hypothetical protein